jgi:hypothetical protein
MEQKVTWHASTRFSWPQFRDDLACRGLAVQLRMIDGQLAFPDEEPPEEWSDLRIGMPSGMVTLRREPQGIRLVVWGNADEALRSEWNALTLVLAKRYDGRIETAQGVLQPEEFAQTVQLPSGMRPGAS